MIKVIMTKQADGTDYNLELKLSLSKEAIEVLEHLGIDTMDLYNLNPHGRFSSYC